MNKIRRKQLEKIANELEALRARIEELQEDEQEYFDNMPEAFQDSDKGENSQACIDLMTDALENAEGAADYLRELIDNY